MQTTKSRFSFCDCEVVAGRAKAAVAKRAKRVRSWDFIISGFGMCWGLGACDEDGNWKRRKRRKLEGGQGVFIHERRVGVLRLKTILTIGILPESFSMKQMEKRPTPHDYR